MKVASYTQISEAEYLALEAQSPLKHEYVAGGIYAMTGASLRHNVIALNIAALLRAHLRGSPCRTFMSDAKLRVNKLNSYYYPDVMVTCDPRHQNITPGDTVIEAPRLVVEILSNSTEATDRREKLLAYRSLPSMLEYVLVSQEVASVEIHRRHGDIGWQIITLSPGDPVELNSVELVSDFAAIYEESGLAL
jgi:Uma2 family endonuclease